MVEVSCLRFSMKSAGLFLRGHETRPTFFLITNQRLGQRDMVESWELVWLTEGINTSQNGTLATREIFVSLFFQDDVGGIRSRLPPLRSLCAGNFQSIST